MSALQYRTLLEEEIGLIATIDRTEEIFEYYVYQDSLKLIPHHETVTQFDPAELEEILSRQHKIMQEGGWVYGAFDAGKLAGVASVEKQRRGSRANYCKMDILYVSNGYRGLKIGQRLLEESKIAARQLGASKLYISATPTRHTVDFYMRQGAVIAQEIDEELFKLEPLDIHLELFI
jgi:GNAT superfamily N-acetyltransferase